jgi:cardiolipin synthase
VYFFYNKQFQIATVIFVIAAFTDALDGYLARILKCQTHFGLIIDPLADKVLIVSCFILLGHHQMLPWSLVMLVLSRDLAITSGAFISIVLLKQTNSLKPSLLSKLNTVLQLTLIVALLIHISFQSLPTSLIAILINSVAITTLTSFIHYFWAWYQILNLNRKNV